MKTAHRVLMIPVLCCFLASCVSTHVDLSQHALNQGKNGSIIFVKNINYDMHGLPLFQPVLSKRPEKADEQFTLVYLADGRPVKSFDIVITQEKLNLDRPKNILYTWTGTGFAVGAVMGEATLKSGGSSGKHAWIVFAVGVAMPLVGGVTGFVIGTWAIVPEAMDDIKKLLTSTESLISYTEYEYDKQGRLKQMKMFQPAEKPIELVRTEFIYNKDEQTPSRTTVTSYPENKTRTIL